MRWSWQSQDHECGRHTDEGWMRRVSGASGGGFAQRDGNGTQEAQNRTQEAQESVLRNSFLRFLCSSLCFLCSVPVPFGKAGGVVGVFAAFWIGRFAEALL